jgi:TonB family protein
MRKGPPHDRRVRRLGVALVCAAGLALPSVAAAQRSPPPARIEVNVSLEPGVYRLRPPFVRDGVRYLEYGSSELARQPRPRADLQVDYPRAALRAGTPAWVVVQLFIDQGGRVEEVSRICGAPEFAEAVAAAARKARFDPAWRRGGGLAPSTIVVEVAFLGAAPAPDEDSLDRLRGSLQDICLREIFGASRRLR